MEREKVVAATVPAGGGAPPYALLKDEANERERNKGEIAAERDRIEGDRKLERERELEGEEGSGAQLLFLVVEEDEAKRLGARVWVQSFHGEIKGFNLGVFVSKHLGTKVEKSMLPLLEDRAKLSHLKWLQGMTFLVSVFLHRRKRFGKLDQIISAHPRLKEHGKFLFIPAPDN